MKHKAIQKVLETKFGVSDEEILSGKYDRQKTGELVKAAVEAEHGRFYFPDTLYDSRHIRHRRAGKRQSSVKLARLAEANGLDLYKYRAIIPQNENDSLYSLETVKKAKECERGMLGPYPRIGALERTCGRDGLIHIQGLVALPASNSYPSEHFQLLSYDEIQEGIFHYIQYILKPGDQNVQRDRSGKLQQPFPLALLAVGDWYIGSLKNQLSGRRNPQIVWTKGIPKG